MNELEGHCDYCNNYLPASELKECYEPFIEEIKHGCFNSLPCICEECCKSRILEQGCTLECKENLEISKNLREEHIDKVLKELNILFVKNDHTWIGSYNNAWKNSWKLSILKEDSEIIPIYSEKYRTVDFKFQFHPIYDTEISLTHETSSTEILLYYSIPVKLFEDLKKTIHPFFDWHIMLGMNNIDKPIYYWILIISDMSGNTDFLYIECKRHSSRENHTEFIYNKEKITVVNKMGLYDVSQDYQDINFYFAQIELKGEYFQEEPGSSVRIAGAIKTEYIDAIKEKIKEKLESAKSLDANIIIFSEYCIPKECIELIHNWVKENDIWVIGGFERMIYENKTFNIQISQYENVALIFTPDYIYYQKKFIHSPKEPYLKPTSKVHIFNSKYGRFAILICADILSDALLSKISQDIDFIIVPSFNQDVKTFDAVCRSMCVKNSCFVILCNNELYEGTGIYGPVKKIDRLIYQYSDKEPFYKENFSDFKKHRLKQIEKSKFKPVL